MVYFRLNDPRIGQYTEKKSRQNPQSHGTWWGPKFLDRQEADTGWEYYESRGRQPKEGLMDNCSDIHRSMLDDCICNDHVIRDLEHVIEGRDMRDRQGDPESVKNNADTPDPKCREHILKLNTFRPIYLRIKHKQPINPVEHSPDEIQREANKARTGHLDKLILIKPNRRDD